MNYEPKLPEEIYINRARQQRNAEIVQGYLGAIFVVFLLIYFGVVVSRVAERIV